MQFPLRGMIYRCRLGTDVILLDGMKDEETEYGTCSIADGINVVNFFWRC